MRLHCKQFVPGVLIATLSSGAFAASIVVNGSFEQGTLVDPFTTVFPGQTNITGWDVGPHSVDYIGSYWQASDGTRSIDLSGNAPGSLSQDLATTIGQSYVVSFDLAGNPDAPDGIPRTGTVQVTVGAATYLLNFDQTTATYANMGWQPQQFTFVANTALTTITFGSTTDDPYGPALDNVSVVAVPLSPASYTGGTLMGLMGIGAWMHRSRKAPIV